MTFKEFQDYLKTKYPTYNLRFSIASPGCFWAKLPKGARVGLFKGTWVYEEYVAYQKLQGISKVSLDDACLKWESLASLEDSGESLSGTFDWWK